jgi:uncharacterized membrane protein HdeD (DUF308 family)
MNAIFLVLSIVDILAGATIVFNISTLATYMMYYCLIKGIWSLISNIAAKYYFDWMGVIDLLAGVTLFLISINTATWIFQVLGFLVVIKGLYSLILSAT